MNFYFTFNLCLLAFLFFHNTCLLFTCNILFLFILEDLDGHFHIHFQFLRQFFLLLLQFFLFLQLDIKKNIFLHLFLNLFDKYPAFLLLLDFLLHFHQLLLPILPPPLLHGGFLLFLQIYFAFEFINFLHLLLPFFLILPPYFLLVFLSDAVD